MTSPRITAETVRADFNDPIAVVHYARAAHFLGLWKSERVLIERYFKPADHLLEAGCGAGRVTLGLWDHGYTHLTAFDFAEELVGQARTLVDQRGADRIRLFHADATHLASARLFSANPADTADTAGSAEQTDGSPEAAQEERIDARLYDGALFMFNGMMQIPGRENRHRALRELHRVSKPGAHLLFTTHDRNHSRMERALWKLEAARWEMGQQDARLLEYGDRYFEDETGRTFMHLPDREEILADLADTGWLHVEDHMRRELARESAAVRDFSDECRFWVARKPAP